MSIEAKIKCPTCDVELSLYLKGDIYSTLPNIQMAPHNCIPKIKPSSEIDLLKERITTLEEEIINIKNTIKFDRMRNRPIRV